LSATSDRLFAVGKNDWDSCILMWADLP